MKCPRCKANCEDGDKRCWQCNRDLGPSLGENIWNVIRVLLVIGVILAVIRECGRP